MPARPETVYDEWLDAEALAEFLCPAPTTSEILECDPRVGGRLRIVMHDGDFTVNIEGVYLELDRPKRLSFSWDSDMGDGFSSVVTVTFEPAGDHETLMIIEHRPLPLGLAEDHQDGWTVIAGQLAARLAARA